LELMDYEALGFKCGLELHQQLDTNKLFCECPSFINNSKPDFVIKRRLTRVAGETGVVDVSAKHEAMKNKLMVYHGHHANTCLVDTDSEPPHNINVKALRAALLLSKLLRMRIVDEIQVMRKTIIDGSVTTGFQRTMLVGVNGYINTEHGKVRVTSLCLEEDACRKIKEDEKSITWCLDRQGIPLIELRTEPDIRSPEQALETAKKLRLLSKLTGLVKRGIGTVRQDVNVSIKGGARVELKGVQNIRKVKQIIDEEIKRQLKLIKARKKVREEVRRVKNDLKSEFLRPLSGAARMYPETDLHPIRINKELIDEISANLPREPDELLKELRGKGLSEEISNQLINSKVLTSFQELVKELSIKPVIIATTLLSFPEKKELVRSVLRFYAEKKISKELISELLKKHDDIKSVEEEVRGAALMSESGVRNVVNKIIEEHKDLLGDERGFNKLMGLVMRELRGKSEGGLIARILKEEMKKHS